MGLQLTMKMKPNPLNFFGIRRLEYPGPHLQYMEVNQGYNLDKAIITWIENNCKSRYYIGRTVGVDNNNTIQNKVRIGFENPKELSYFALACPLLKYK